MGDLTHGAELPDSTTLVPDGGRGTDVTAPLRLVQRDEVPVTEWDGDPVANALGIYDFNPHTDEGQDNEAQNAAIIREMKRLLALDPDSDEINDADREILEEYRYLVGVAGLDRDRCSTTVLADLLDQEESATRGNVLALLGPRVYELPDYDKEAGELAAMEAADADMTARIAAAEDQTR